MLTVQIREVVGERWKLRGAGENGGGPLSHMCGQRELAGWVGWFGGQKMVVLAVVTVVVS